MSATTIISGRPRILSVAVTSIVVAETAGGGFAADLFDVVAGGKTELIAPGPDKDAVIRLLAAIRDFHEEAGRPIKNLMLRGPAVRRPAPVEAGRPRGASRRHAAAPVALIPPSSQGPQATIRGTA